MLGNLGVLEIQVSVFEYRQILKTRMFEYLKFIKVGEKDLRHPRHPCFRPGLRTTVLAVGTSTLPFLALATSQLNIY